MLHSNKIKTVVSFGLLFVLTGCHGGTSDLQSFVDNAFKDESIFLCGK